MTSVTSQSGQAMGYETEAASSKRLLGLGLAILFHALLLYGLMSGLGRELVQKVQKTVNVSIIEEPPPPPPPLPEETVDRPAEASPKAQVKPKAYVPKVETNVKQVASEGAITSTASTQADTTPVVRQAPVETAPAPPPPPKEQKITSPKLVQGCALPRYPERSLEKGEEGLVVFRFLIGLDGVVKDSVLVQSSGFDRLDAAAKQAFQRCKFVPGMLDGTPREAWVRQPFRWRLQ